MAAPEGVDTDFFASLPPSLQREVMLQHGVQPRDETGVCANPVGGEGGSSEHPSSYDPDVLAALPDDIRAEMLDAERR